MTAPMPETMSPREKVELKPCPFCGGDAVAGSNFDNDHYVMCGADCDKCGGMVGYMKTEMAAIENWNRRTALASGSGDHAELARLVEWRDRLRADPGRAAHFGSPYADKPMQNGRTYWNSDLADDITALIAEVAALRDQLDWMTRDRNAVIGERDRADTMMQSVDDRATEAERKLAEAVGLNDRAAELMRQCTDPKRFEGASTLNVYANMRAWLSDLSKEAERG